MSLESIQRPVPGPARLWRDFGLTYAGTGLVGFIFAASGPVAIILTTGTSGGLSADQMSSWILGAFLINSLLTIGLCLTYRSPLVFFWTIPGTVLVGNALTHLSFAEVVGAYLVTGALMLGLGLTGWMRRVMNVIPLSIVMAMVAGVFLQFGLNLIFALRDGFAIAAPMCAVFVLLSAVPAFGRAIPPLIGALAVGAVAIAFAGGIDLPSDFTLAVTQPLFVRPDFSLIALGELVVPLAITVIVVQNGQGIAVLRSARHDPPINAITTACGAVSILTATLGTVSTCLTGPTNAIVTSAGERDRHYTAGIFVAVLAAVFGLFASAFTDLMLASPPAFIATVAGLAMLRVLQSSMTTAFSGSCGLGALVTFLVTLANVPIGGLGAPFWGLVFGCLTSWLLERKDYVQAVTPPAPRG